MPEEDALMAQSTLGVVGLGAFGGAIAARLVRQGFPLMVFDPRKGEKIRECISLAGNPAMKEDWYIDPHTNQAVDFVDDGTARDRLWSGWPSPRLPARLRAGRCRQA